MKGKPRKTEWYVFEEMKEDGPGSEKGQAGLAEGRAIYIEVQEVAGRLDGQQWVKKHGKVGSTYKVLREGPESHLTIEEKSVEQTKRVMEPVE